MPALFLVKLPRLTVSFDFVCVNFLQSSGVRRLSASPPYSECCQPSLPVLSNRSAITTHARGFPGHRYPQHTPSIEVYRRTVLKYLHCLYIYRRCINCSDAHTTFDGFDYCPLKSAGLGETFETSSSCKITCTIQDKIVMRWGRGNLI